jgi:hypothetical protein
MRPATENARPPTGAPVAGASSGTSDTDVATPYEAHHEDAVTLQDLDAAMRSALALGDDLDRAVRLREIARGIAPKDMPAALEQAGALPEGERYEAISILGAQWGRTAPQVALDFALHWKVEDGRSPLLSASMEAWTVQAPDEAATWIGRLPLGENRDKAFAAMLGIAAKRVPQRIPELLRNHAVRDHENWMVSRAFGKWAQNDPSAAAAAALLLPQRKSVRDSALAQVAEAWAENDPSAALTWVDQTGEPSLRRKLATVVAIQWGRKDPTAAFAYALQPGHRDPQSSALLSVVSGWAADDPAAAQTAVLALPQGRSRDEALQGLVTGMRAEAALALLAQLPGGSKNGELFNDVVRGLDIEEMSMAANYVGSLPPGSLRIQMSGGLAVKWAESDLDGALAWAKQLPSGRERDGTLAQLAYYWASASPREAVELLARESAGGPRDYGLENALRVWTQSAPEEALAWVLAQPVHSGRDPLVLNLITELQRTDPVQAAQLFTTQLTSATDGNVAGQIADAWAGEDPQAAVKWATTLPDETARSRALGGAVGVWASHDPVAAASYVQSLSVSPMRDAAVESLSNAIWHVDHEGAIAWMATLGDPGQRVGRLTGFVTGWLDEDATAARTWLDRTTLFDAATKRRLLYRFAHPDGPDDAPP